MGRKTMSMLLLSFCAVSLAIAVYQAMDSRMAAAGLSIVFSLVFLFGGVMSRKK